MNKKQNVEKDLFVDFTRLFIHVIENQFNQESTHTIEKVFFFVFNDNSDKYTESHVQSRFEIEENTISRDVENHKKANFEQDFEKRRHNQ